MYAVQKQHGLNVLSHKTRLQGVVDLPLCTTNTPISYPFIHYFDLKYSKLLNFKILMNTEK